MDAWRFYRRNVRSLLSDYGHLCGNRASFRKPVSARQSGTLVMHGLAAKSAMFCADFIVRGLS